MMDRCSLSGRSLGDKTNSNQSRRKGNIKRSASREKVKVILDGSSALPKKGFQQRHSTDTGTHI